MTATTRRPFCCHCGALGAHWYQPLIGTENFCSIACAQAYTREHTFNGQAQAIHTAACAHFAPDQEPQS